MRIRVWARALMSAAYFAVPAGGAVITAASCADLEDIELGRCGNRVLDEGEDCDGHDDPSGSLCAPPGDRNACRFTCSFASPETSTPCPEGTRCGVGDVCTHPSNAFSLEEAALVGRGGDAFAAADFDGDRLTDIAVVSEAEGELFVSFLGGLTPILETTIPVTPTRTMAVGKIDTDGRPDVALGADAAVASLGSASGRRELVSTAFPQYDFDVDLARVLAAPAQSNVYPNPAPAQAKLEDDADSEAVILNFPGSSQIYIRNPYDGSTPSTPLLPELGGLVGQTRGNVYPRGVGPACDEFALAFQASVVVVKLCDDDGAPLFPLPDGELDCLPEQNCIVTESMTGTVRGIWPAQLAEPDMTLDPEVELVVLVETQTGLDLRVVEADPVGPAPLRTRAVLGGIPGSIEAIDLAKEGPPLYLGDLNGDAEIDAVTSEAIHLSNGGPSYVAAVGSIGKWNEVAVGDFNDDGLLDVAAGRGTTQEPADNLDIMLGSSSSYYNPVILPTDGKASVFGVGDFDGDGIDDLVFRSRSIDLAKKVLPPALPGCTDLDDLRIFFGSDSGLGEGSTLGKIAGIEQLVVGRLPRLDKRDGISDFGLVSHCLTVDTSGNPEPDNNRITVFYGALSRQVAAPFLLNDTRGGDGNATLDLVPFGPAAIAAREVGDVRVVATAAERLDAYASSAQPLHPVAIFALETRDGVVFKNTHYVPASLGREGLSIALGNLDGDPQLEIAVADETAIQIIRHFECFPASYETSVKLDASSEACQLGMGPGVPVSTDQLSTAFVTGRISTPVDWIVGLDAADLDRDGYDDLVVFGASSGVPAALIIWGGNFDPATNTLVTFAGAGPSNAAAFLPTYPDAGAPADGATVPIQLLLSVPSESGFTLTAVELSGREVVAEHALATIGDVTDLAVADIDGDGFEDVAALTTQAVRVLRRQPVLAGDRPMPQAGGEE